MGWAVSAPVRRYPASPVPASSVARRPDLRRQRIAGATLPDDLERWQRAKSSNKACFTSSRSWNTGPSPARKRHAGYLLACAIRMRSTMRHKSGARKRALADHLGISPDGGKRAFGALEAAGLIACKPAAAAPSTKPRRAS